MRFWLTSKDNSSSCAILCCLVKMLSFNPPWEFPNKANHVRHALCQVLKHGDEPSNCESSCPCYYSQIEGLGLHVVTITHYVIRIKKHLHNRIEIIKNWKAIIKIKSNRKEYESLHPYHYYIESFLCPSGKRSCIFSKFNLLNVDTPLKWTF